MSYSTLAIDHPRKVSRQILGSFPSGETGTLSGTLSGFASGQVHGYTISCIYPDGTETVLSGGDEYGTVQLTPDVPAKLMTIPGTMYHPAIFFWPTRANGGGYYTSLEDAREGI